MVDNRYNKCVIRQRRLITGLKISYQRRYNIYVLMKCQERGANPLQTYLLYGG